MWFSYLYFIYSHHFFISSQITCKDHYFLLSISKKYLKFVELLQSTDWNITLLFKYLSFHHSSNICSFQNLIIFIICSFQNLTIFISFSNLHYLISLLIIYLMLFIKLFFYVHNNVLLNKSYFKIRTSYLVLIWLF